MFIAEYGLAHLDFNLPSRPVCRKGFPSVLSVFSYSSISFCKYAIAKKEHKFDCVMTYDSDCLCGLL